MVQKGSQKELTWRGSQFEKHPHHSWSIPHVFSNALALFLHGVLIGEMRGFDFWLNAALRCLPIASIATVVVV